MIWRVASSRMSRKLQVKLEFNELNEFGHLDQAPSFLLELSCCSFVIAACHLLGLYDKSHLLTN